MPYNEKQYDAAEAFIQADDANLSSNTWDQKRIGVYDLYENLYRNALITLQINIRGEDQTPILMPNAQKMVEATTRFLAKNVDYYVDVGGDEGARQQVDLWWSDFFKREAFPTKFDSNVLWGLVRGDAYWFLYANPDKPEGERISIKELDPRYVFEIEDEDGSCVGVHIVELVQDFRDLTKVDKKIVRRRTFRKVYTPSSGEDFDDSATMKVSVTSELSYWEIGKWDDRSVAAKDKQEKVPAEGREVEEFFLPETITELPVYKWSNKPAQNSSWGTSQISGLETVLYALNQSLSDEDAILVFQGLGMYVTNAAPPLDENNEVTDWNVGPKQVIELSGDQRFERITGVSDVSPIQEHMKFIDDGMSEASGTPQVAIGRVDVAVAESGISLQLQMLPIIAGNQKKEQVLVNIMDQMFHDITTMWLPAYEFEQFGNFDIVKELNVVVLFDDPMPVDKKAVTEDIIALDTANLILKSMAVARLRELGWKYPTVDPFTGMPLTDDDIAAMLLNQAAMYAQASDPFATSLGNGEVDPNAEVPPEEGGETPDEMTIDLGSS